MPRIAYVTDSTCNLPEDLMERHSITVVPVYVLFGDQSYKDYVELPPSKFYRRLSVNLREFSRKFAQVGGL